MAAGYARAGARVVLAGRTKAQLDQTVQQIREAGGDGLGVPTDVTNLAAVESLFQVAKEHYGSVDIVVINAGITDEKESVVDSDPEVWRHTIDVNLIGAYYCARTAIPYLRERGHGKIILVGSGLGHHGQASRSAYACSKAGLWMLTRVLADELWDEQISVNELIPGPVQTAMATNMDDGHTVFDIPSEWIKSPEEVVPLALFLAAQPCIGPTGQSFSLMRRTL